MLLSQLFSSPGSPEDLNRSVGCVLFHQRTESRRTRHRGIKHTTVADALLLKKAAEWNSFASGRKHSPQPHSQTSRQVNTYCDCWFYLHPATLRCALKKDIQRENKDTYTVEEALWENTQDICNLYIYTPPWDLVCLQSHWGNERYCATSRADLADVNSLVIWASLSLISESCFSRRPDLSSRKRDSYQIIIAQEVFLITFQKC